jgi:hypothetical protein
MRSVRESIWRGSFEDALELSKRTIEKFPLILFLTFLGTYFLNMAVESPFAAPQAELNDSVRIFSQMMLVLWSLIEGFIFFLVTVKVPVRADLMKHQVEAVWNKETWVGLAAEPLRALMYIILWSLLFLIPGLIFYALYSFVMYVVLFSKEYQAGNEDALKLSKALVKPMFFSFALANLAFSGASSAFGMAPQVADVFNLIPLRVLCELIAFLISLYSYSLMRILFHKAMIRHLEAKS